MPHVTISDVKNKENGAERWLFHSIFFPGLNGKDDKFLSSFFNAIMYLLCLDFEIEAGALDGVGAHFAVGYSHVVGMLGVAFEGFFRLEGAVEHHVSIRRGESAVDVDLHVDESWHFANKAFKTFLDACFHYFLFFVGQFGVECPKDDVLYHIG